jgi:DnaJ-class molecular chaperone
MVRPMPTIGPRTMSIIPVAAFRPAGWEVVVGLLRFLFGDDLRSRSQRDQYSPDVVLKNAISPINHYGTCFSCGGAGQRRLECRACHGRGVHSFACRGCQGSGEFVLRAQACFACEGSGMKSGSPCSRCQGSGQFKPEVRLPCRRCSGGGRHSSECRKCLGSGSYTVSCRKCAGTGWYKQGPRS